MRDFREQNFYELLEVQPHSTQQELERSYQQARRFFSPDSVATYALFQPEELHLMRRRIEEAFRTLSDPVKRRAYDMELAALAAPPAEPAGADEAPTVQEETAAAPLADSKADTEADGTVEQKPEAATESPPEPTVPEISEETEVTGELLKQARLARGMTLHDYVQVTKISIYYLRNLENEKFDDLPATVYVRGYLRQMATLLGLDPQRVSTEYIERMKRIWGGEEE